jgi:hypothetical protein
MIIGRLTGNSHSSLIHSPHSELIHHLLRQISYCSYTVRSFCFGHLSPIDGKLVFDFNDVVSDRPTTIAGGGCPFQFDTLVVIVDNLGFTGLTRLVCRRKTV